jgi:hypothetical protein
MKKIPDFTFVMAFIFSIAFASLLISQQKEDITLAINTLEETNNSAKKVSSTTTTIDVDINELADNFIEYYLQNKIEGYVEFTSIELEKTISLHRRAPNYFELNEYECFRKDRGTTHEALLNEYFPVIYENRWYFKEYATVKDSNGKSYVYLLNVSYNCKLKTDESEYPVFIPLYGNPFFKDGNWWIYKYKEWEPVPMAVPGSLTYLSSKIGIKNFEKVYEEWVFNAVPPEIEITNCPDFEINEDTYELKYEIYTGNAGLDYFGTFVEKDGEILNRAFFEKGWNDDIFSFASADTTNSYGQLIDNTESSGLTTYLVELSVGNEYDLDAYASCKIVFNN